MIDTVVVVGGMGIAHMGLGISIDVPQVVDDNDLNSQSGILFDTLDRDIVDWDSIFFLSRDHYILDLYHYYPIFYPC